MNNNQLQTSWPQIKVHVKKQWEKLTDDEIEKVNGNKEQLCGFIQKHYDLKKEEAEKQVQDFLNRDLKK